MFSDLIRIHLPQYVRLPIADIAAGKGHLQAALRQKGFERITSFDRRKSFAGHRSIYRYGLFDWKTSEKFSLAIGMHPDDATDHIVKYGRENEIPWIVCPCCVRPSAASFGKTMVLPMDGRNVVLAGNLDKIAPRF